MRDLLPPTAGFLPLHLYEGPDLDRAIYIASAINSFAMEAMGFGRANRLPLEALSLRDMLDAVDIVERYNDRPRMYGVVSSCCMVPAERLTAAVYTLLHFFDRRALDADGDDVPVRFSYRNWGQESVHFLLVGNRPSEAFEADEEDDEAAA